jgi:hypothetical protein
VQIDWDELFNEPRRPQPPQVGRSWWLAIALLAIGLVAVNLIGLISDYLWFDSLGQRATFLTRLGWPLALGLATAALCFLWLAANGLWAQRRIAADPPPAADGAPRPTAGFSRRSVVLLAALLALFAGAMAAGVWQIFALARHAQLFGVTDPIFGRDVGFYVFQLPAWEAARSLGLLLVLVTLAGMAGLYLAGGLIDLRRGRLRLARPARAHLLVLAALALLLWGSGRWLARFGLLFSTHSDSFAGPGFAEITVRSPVLAFLAGASVVGALFLLVAIRFPGRRLPLWTFAVLVGVALLAGEVWPALVYQWRVKPNELTLERPYIAHNINFTRAAFNLKGVTTSEYTPSAAVNQELLADNAGTLANVRLWDWRVFQSTVSQVQSIRSYYNFMDVDVDRYQVGVSQRQVNLTVRELLPNMLQNPTWVNRHIEYTHGFGAVVSPIDEVEDRGLPVLWMKDIPPELTPPFKAELGQPRIYFGEALDQSYVVVGATQDEFDYPAGDRNERTRYSGRDGVGIGNLWRRLLFALRFGDSELLLSTALTPESRILLTRGVRERIEKIAPFLDYDHDPYPIIAPDGRLIWLLDAYTTTSLYPYSTPLGESSGFDGQLGELTGQRYVRNSVKVALDAYEGLPHFYVVDESDPLVKAWSGLYPDLFQPVSAMPEALRAHWRYPEVLFRAQSAIFAKYHVIDPATFYNAEDRWAVASEMGVGGDVDPMMPYYVTLKLRDGVKPEFVLILPFVPVGKDNMISWLAARSDPENYGELVLYQFSKGSLVYGPSQIESLIQQDPQISSQVTLWGQAGSRVSYGNLLVIPLGDAILYAEPLYIQATQGSALPELKRVIVAAGDKVIMRPTLKEALIALVESPISAVVTAAPPVPGSPSSGTTSPGSVAPSTAIAATDIAGLARQAGEYQRAAAAALRADDWVGFGQAMADLQTTLNRLSALTGAVLPAVSGTPATSPLLPAVTPTAQP